MEQEGEEKFIFIQKKPSGHRINGIILYYKIYNKYHRLSALAEKVGYIGELKKKLQKYQYIYNIYSV